MIARNEIFSIVWRALWRYRRRTAAALALLVVAKVFALLVPVALKYIIDGLDSANAPLTLPVFLLLAYALLRFLSGLFTELRDMVFALVTQTAVAQATERVFGHLHRLAARFHGDQQTGVFARDVSRGTAGIGFLMGTALFTLLPTLIEIVSIMIILLSAYRAGFAGVLTLTFVAYAVYTWVYTEKRIRYQRVLNDLDSAASGQLVDSLLNYETVKLYNGEQVESRRLGDIMGRWVGVGLQNQTALSMLHVGQSAIIAAGVAWTMLMAGSEVVQGRMAVGDLVLINAYVIQVCLPLNMLGLIFRQAREAVINAERMAGMLRLPVETAGREHLPALRAGDGEVVFENVNFAYEPSRPILHEISFRIEPAQQVAVVGGSGSGKSTLSRLLLRLYDADSGVIAVDGQDVSTVSHASVRAQIGVVPQDSLLFNNTIFFNIAYGMPDATMEQVVAAAKAARIHDLVESLPARYDTPVGERGIKLSGGERQRISIARAFLKNPRILVLDEATSALDTRTERAIQVELKKLSAGRTTLIIAHRLSTVVEADQILVMEQGKIIERGTHDALLAARGHYAQMWDLQRQQQALDGVAGRLHAQPINLVTLAAGVLDAARPAIEGKDIVLYTLIRTDSARVTGDPSATQALVGEMLDNAIAFTPPSGRIELVVERDGAEVVVSITDGRLIGTGARNAGPPGWGADDVLHGPTPAAWDTPVLDSANDTLLEAGARDVAMPHPAIEPLDPARARSLMRQMGGRFTAGSAADGSGYTFTIRMPLRAVVQLPGGAARRDGQPGRLRNLRVFVADDQKEALRLLADVLRDHGAAVQAFESGESVLEKLESLAQSEWPDVLVCDITLGELDGYQVIAAVRRAEAKRKVPLAQRLPAIALSGHAAPEDRLYALLAGFQVYMTKPVDGRELAATVLTLTGGGAQAKPATPVAS